MSDFLQNLLARNAPVVPETTLRPRLPSLFESADAETLPSLPIETRSEQTAPSQVNIPQASSPQVNTIRNTEIKTDAPLKNDAPQRAGDSNAPQPGFRLDKQDTPLMIQPPDAPVANLTVIRSTVATIRPPEMAEQSRANATPSQVERPVIQPPPYPPPAKQVQQPAPSRRAQPETKTRAETQRVALQETQTGHEAPDEHETTIRVHIGRIDVRAVTAPVPSQPAQQSPKTRSTLSLDDYLKQRSEGKR